MSEAVNKNCAQRVAMPCSGLLRGSTGRCLGRAITTRPWLFLWGGVNQLVLSVAAPTLNLLPIWLWATVAHTHTSTGSIHTSPQIHKCSLCFIITRLSLNRTFHTLAPTVERVVGTKPDTAHYPLCSSFSIYLHRWRCRCCWRLFCTGPEQELCGGGGRSADPTEMPTKDHYTLFHLYQLNLLQT